MRLYELKQKLKRKWLHVSYFENKKDALNAKDQGMLSSPQYKYAIFIWERTGECI